MQSIGEQIEEARKRKGISLREAAEATKIRSDFLSSIEQNKFDFDLPDIYKRGFLKNYARYLKLDPDKIIAEFNAQQLSKVRSSRRGATELFGSMEAKDESEKVSDSHAFIQDESQSLGRIKPRHRPGSADLQEDGDGEEESDKIFYLKAGALCIGVVTLIIILFGLAQAILGSDAPADLDTAEENPAITDDSGTSGAGLTERDPALASQDDKDTFELVASGIVYVIVRQKNDGKELFRGTLSEGQTIPLEKDGPADIVFTVAENLLIKHNGERIKPDGTGNAKISLR